MSLIINTNTEALIAQNNLSNTEGALNSAMTDLSSGLRINTAADDAAGYAITEDLTSQVNGQYLTRRPVREIFQGLTPAERKRQRDHRRFAKKPCHDSPYDTSSERR